MASNTSEIKQRITSIGSTQKITKAMKLVSFSKLQRYRRRLDEFAPYYDSVSKASEQFLPFDEALGDHANLYLIFMPDLGLCSAYTQGLMRELHRVIKDGDQIISIGTQFHDFMIKKGLPIVNKTTSSEHADMNKVVKDVSSYLGNHNIISIVPEYLGSVDLTFTHHPLLTKVTSQRDDVIYEPSFTLTAEMLVKQALNSLVRFSFLASKVSEHTARRIAMEKATDSAQDMIDDLQLKYNKARQEAITQEIAEIVSGMEVS